MPSVRDRVHEFVLEDLLLGDSEAMPAEDESLLESGTIDSTGILELIQFLEAEFGIEIADDETVPENLDGIARIVDYIGRKTGSSPE